MSDITNEKLFHSGHFQQILNNFHAPKARKPQTQHTLTGLFYVVGSHVFLGDLNAAKTLMDQHDLYKYNHPLFYYCLGLIRSSQYKQAKKMIEKLLVQRSSPSDFFYAYQAVGFFRYFCCRYSKALLWANKAERYASTSYQKMIQQDLLGHIYIRCGRIQKGLALGKSAAILAHQLNNTSALDALNVSHAIYNSQWTTQNEETLQKLLNLKIHFLESHTYYSMNLSLEYIRRLHLSGELELAQQELLAIQKPIFESSLGRQKALWSFRMAHHLFLRRELPQSLDMCQSAIDYLDTKIDLQLTLQIMGLKYKILKIQKKMSPGDSNHPTSSIQQLDSLEKKLKHLTFLTQDAQALSYAYRYGWIKKPITEDPYAPFFHRWIREGYKDYSILKQVVEKKWFSLFIDLIAHNPSLFLYLDMLPKTVFIFTPQNIKLRYGLTPLTRQALLLLAKQKYSKKEFVETLWGYEYDPQRHDSLLHALIHRLRHLLGGAGERVQLTHDKVSLQQMEVRVYEHMELPRVKTKTAIVTEAQGLGRQHLEILEFISKNKYITVSQATSLLQASQITACRALKHLVDENKIRRIGKGRATSYTL